MSVHIIIDGYNLIRQSASLQRLEQVDLQTGREALIRRLVAYKRIRPHKITVVFDGTGDPGLSPSRDRVGGISIVFSRSGETADAVIAAMARRFGEKAMVVSSDRGVTNSAAAAGAAVIGSPEFEERVEMAAYMEIKGDDGEPSEGWSPTTRKKGPRRRLPKRQRRNSAKIQKL
ncbi:MAG: NYN domain-containing protein [Desulfobacterales bacterium]|nr:NYN domain-containing protein [Desulfobacterales bacterium]